MSSSLQAGRSLLCSSQADSSFIIIIVVVVFPLDEEFSSSCLLLEWGNGSQGAAPRKAQDCLWQAGRRAETLCAQTSDSEHKAKLVLPFLPEVT